MICTHDAASHFVKTIPVNATVREAAKMMEVHNIGFLPVMRESQIVGVVTDRDIALRAAHSPLPLSGILVMDVMTPSAITIHDNATIAESAERMAKNNIRRLIVIDHRGTISGVLSLDDVAVYSSGDQTVGQILQKMAKPTAPMHIDVDLGGDTVIAGRLYVEHPAARAA